MKFIKTFESSNNQNIIDKAIEFGDYCHSKLYKGEGPQLRKYTGEPYITENELIYFLKEIMKKNEANKAFLYIKELTDV